MQKVCLKVKAKAEEEEQIKTLYGDAFMNKRFSQFSMYSEDDREGTPNPYDLHVARQQAKVGFEGLVKNSSNAKSALSYINYDSF